MRHLLSDDAPGEPGGVVVVRVLVCGSRDWDDFNLIDLVLCGFFYLDTGYEPTVIHGGARGADRLAGEWVRRTGRIHHVLREEVYLADWETHGKAAGPIRNQQMLDEGKPDAVLAFHDMIGESRGTLDMVRRGIAADLPVYVFSGWNRP